MKLCYKIIYNFTNTSPILKSSRILRFKTLNFSLNIKQSRLCFKPLSDYFRCCLKVSIHAANIIDHDVAIALVIKRTAGKINGVLKSIASYSQVYLCQLHFFGPICFHFKQINLCQCRKNVHSSCANVGSTALCLKQYRRYEGQGALPPFRFTQNLEHHVATRQKTMMRKRIITFKFNSHLTCSCNQLL